ncbi:flagellar hook-basal body complex protein FliE [Thermosyntropha lipolytica DSM 11003]|uniref:Flagellar hook-basal body complex protein FliE n=1 Tax=Thermosyntropha lipolytica DSM 11003 TaxID=1123382 RepID=A0A1M5L0B0_9FIRM|nr:flagellar hook-basal body complex protein FliE [Thermosyntropha lipolytica]SHG58504.1 flagellar hook-basal body complex protein FliE [Thermosyntropha lipolytica DSM 11003]
MKPVGLDWGLLNTHGLAKVKETRDHEKGVSFAELLNQALRQVDSLQKDASASAVRLLTGEEEYLHNVMIAYEKASLALQLTVEIRNKVLEAYQELMRMQM